MDKIKANQILSLLKKNYPNAKIVLKYSNNFELLVAVMLSAQTTDVQVNKVVEKLFPKFRKITQDTKLKSQKYKNKIKKITSEILEIINFANADIKELENDIKSIGLYKNKAGNIKATSELLLDKFNGKIPKTIRDLTILPGVGRKTANVVLGNAYGIFEGIAVDTHVTRLSQKYGFTKQNNPEKTEKDLMLLFDKKDWFLLTYLLIEHGRNIRKTKKDFILHRLNNNEKF